MKQLFFVFFLLLHFPFLNSMNQLRLMPSLAPDQPFHLVSKDQYKFPIPSYYRYLFAKALKETETKDLLLLPYEWQDTHDIAKTLNDLDQHNLTSAIERCQNNSSLIEKLEQLGLQKQLLQPVAWWAVKTELSKNDQNIIDLFLEYRKEFESRTHNEKTKNNSPLVCMCTPNSYNPYLFLLKKQINHIHLKIIKEFQEKIITFSSRNTHYSQIEQVEISCDGLFFVGKFGTILYMVDTQSGNLLDYFDAEAQIDAFVVAPDNKHILITTPKCFLAYELKRGYGQFYCINNHVESNVNCIAISPNSSFVVTGQEDGTISFYTSEITSKLTKCYENRMHQPAKITVIAVKSDNDTVIVADENSRMSVYSFNQKKLLESRSLNDKDTAIKRINLIHNESYLFVESINKIVPPFSSQFAIHPIRA